MNYKMQQLNQINILAWAHLLLLAFTNKVKNPLTKGKIGVWLSRANI